MNKTILTTGTAGFIMSHVARELLAAGHTVVGLDDLSGGHMRNVPDNVCFYKGSIGNEELVQNIFQHHSFDAVIHGAAMAAENLSHNCRAFTVENNLLGEMVVRNAAINHKVQVMASLSSIAVMGHQEPPFHDDTPPTPVDPYGWAKYAGELDARSAHSFHGMNYVVFRPHNVVGVGQNLSDPFRNVASIFIRQALLGEQLTIFGDGSQTRAFSPVSYVAKVIAASIDRPETWNQVYNLGSDRVLSVYDLAIKIGRLICNVPVGGSYDINPKWLLRFLPARKEAQHAHMTHAKVQAAFPDILDIDSLELVLADMVADAQGKINEPMRPGPPIEVTDGLPDSWKPFI